MDAAQSQAFEQLIETLKELSELYSRLLDVVRRERELLIEAKAPELDENNQRKETLIRKVRLADQLRIKRAEEAARRAGANAESPRLLELAARVQGPVAESLRSWHKNLDSLLREIAELNRENEEYARNALDTLSGAMNEIKGTLAGKKTYERKGNYKLGPETTGNFVSKEA